MGEKDKSHLYRLKRDIEGEIKTATTPVNVVYVSPDIFDMIMNNKHVFIDMDLAREGDYRILNCEIIPDSFTDDFTVGYSTFVESMKFAGCFVYAIFFIALFLDKV